ncbi:uncharacterized protein LOC126847605 isoform X2 [Adelges cooleyi]|uniref:uncharacterized protein LOC126847605 isoform X2 n=1 Tax=Adelges cooleyi TaxID=133065 RepID=UPI002180622A|nr:uncharacterized protein LOC126847605 isoform X2 [Adelges cooleyi]XP_050443877.1 uncharacterized protein LOC126847605 isoform X2 [Adelges cooleyi]XP_050443884.1 uncharacterized protein LOC126847605 isoform X2 [Adelges cooleyi]
MTLGLKMIDVLVPRFADLRQSVVLGCSFEVGHGKLYSVKWYKDDNEFYRFIPEDLPAVQVFKQPGITLDLSRCNMRRVTLGNLTFQTSGIYRCEVSTDAPKFEMVFKSANMTVIAYPEGNPLIEGVRSRYAVGDIVSGNCTSFKSYPQPSLTWYINGVQASDRQVEIYPVLVNPEGPLYSKAVGIRFKVEKDHFQGLNVELDLTCEASLVQEQLKWRKMIVIQPLTQTYTDNMLQEEYRNTGNTLTLRKQLSILTGLLITSYLTVCKT